MILFLHQFVKVYLSHSLPTKKSTNKHENRAQTNRKHGVNHETV